MSDDLDLDDLEHVAVDECDHEGTIVPVDADWARCTKCGDSTFPLSYRAAYGSGQPVELVGTINGKVMIGEAFGNTALLFRAQEAEKERDQLNTRVAEMQKSLGNVIRSNGFLSNEKLRADLEAKTEQCEAWKSAAEYVEEYVPYQHGVELYKAARALEAKPETTADPIPEWEESPTHSGYWWFQGRFADDCDPVLDMFFVCENESGDLRVVGEPLPCPLPWIGTWFPIAEPEPDFDGDKVTLEYMGYKTATEANPLLCSYKSGDLLCSLSFPCVGRKHRTEAGVEFEGGS